MMHLFYLHNLLSSIVLFYPIISCKLVQAITQLFHGSPLWPVCVALLTFVLNYWFAVNSSSDSLDELWSGVSSLINPFVSFYPSLNQNSSTECSSSFTNIFKAIHPLK